MTSKLLHLLQICDSNFPSGAFSHSFGLETYIQEEKIVDRQSFLHAIRQYLSSQCVYTDGLACRLAYEAIKNNQLEKVWRIDQELFALGSAKETREGNRRIGRQLLKVMNELYNLELLKIYETKIKAKKCHGHSALVFAIVCEGLH
jgi:urease accessory protein